MASSIEQGWWQRGERVFAHLSERRARYPSIARAGAGRLLILFTHQTEAQEAEGRGDLFLLRRSQDGGWWRLPERVYQGGRGEPRAHGTLSALDSGRIIAPFVEVEDQKGAGPVRVLASDDHGQTWSIGSPVAIDPLVWAAPCGRLLEIGDELVMPVFGALTVADLEATRLAAGLLRSRDNGQTWGDWSPIAGPDPHSEVSFEFPAVLPLAEGTLLAILTGRRLEPRPHLPLDVPQALVRTWSADGGRTWSAPEHLAVGAWPSLIRVDEETVACVFALWAGWAGMEVMLSRDGFRSVRHRLPGSAFVNHGWLPGYNPGEWGRGWARDPIPLPPVVPGLKGDWAAGHYGFSSGLALDQDRLLVVLGQRQREMYDADTPIEKERIETITVEKVGERAPAGPAGRHGEPASSWYLAEYWSLEEWQRRTGQPLEQAWTLKSGRWVRLESETLIPDWHETWYDATIGHEKGWPVGILGYRIGRELEGRSATRLSGAFSEDQGATWHQARLSDPGPLGAAAFPGGNFVEEPDGTLVAPVYGYQTDEDLGIHLYTCTLVRSHDGGESWGDWSVVAYDEDRRFNFSETALVAFPDNTWVVFMRSESVYQVPYDLCIKRAVSADCGRTWSAPEPCAAAGVYGCLTLPDGGVAVAAQNTCGWGLTISYDYGRTWDYALPATYAPTRTGVLDEKTFWIYDQHGSMVSVYRRD